MPTATEISFRDGLAGLLDWLTDHPDIPIAYVHYADNVSAELSCPAGRFDAIATAVAVAEALVDVTIDVADPDGKRVAYWTVSGFTDDPDRLEIIVEGSCFDAARTALLSSLGPAPVAADRAWSTTVEHLRALLPGERLAGDAS